ncbi:MAG: hypothetical protein LBP50_06195, partial [Tannerella sp.]|nr:hypothetical protein [Tannerella sp.]
MGCGCMVSHNKDNSPYTGGNFTYYRKNTSSISGPSLLCSGSSGTFTVSNAPSGYTWSYGSYLTPGSSSGNSKTFTAGSSDGLGWVAVKLGSTELARKEVWVGKPTDTPSQESMSGVPLGQSITIT